jgi:hypothetical protein
MDNPSSGKTDSPLFQTESDRPVCCPAPPACSDPIAISHSEFIAISHSELGRFFDRHQLGIANRDHLGTMIFITSE